MPWQKWAQFQQVNAVFTGPRQYRTTVTNQPPKTSHREIPPRKERRILRSPVLRCAAMVFGWLMVGIGLLGVFVPLFPTTVFLLIALWAFSISSPRFRHWLFEHRWFGPPLRAWVTHRAIPKYAKVLSVASMVGSVIVIALFAAVSWVVPALAAAVSAPVALFIVSRPSAENI